jgi:hypothetical protein
MTTFGPDPGGWGSFAEDDASEVADESAPDGPLGDGHFIKIDPVQWQALLHRADVVTAVILRGEALANTANNMVTVDPETFERLGGNQHPAYEITVQNRSNTKRARVRVHPHYASKGESLGFIDEATNSTLWKAYMQFPSDPIPTAEEAVTYTDYGSLYKQVASEFPDAFTEAGDVS